LPKRVRRASGVGWMVGESIPWVSQSSVWPGGRSNVGPVGARHGHPTTPPFNRPPPSTIIIGLWVLMREEKNGRNLKKWGEMWEKGGSSASTSGGNCIWIKK